MTDPASVAFDHAAIGMALVALDGRLLRVNPLLCALLGRSEDELAGANLVDLTDPADVGNDVEPARRLVAGEIDVHRTKRRFVHRDGYVVWVMITAALTRDEDGHPQGYFVQFEDVTASTGTGVALRASEQRLEAMVRNAADIIAVVDTGGTVRYIRPSVTRLFGFERE